MQLTRGLKGSQRLFKSKRLYASPMGSAGPMSSFGLTVLNRWGVVSVKAGVLGLTMVPGCDGVKVGDGNPEVGGGGC